MYIYAPDFDLCRTVPGWGNVNWALVPGCSLCVLDGCDVLLLDATARKNQVCTLPNISLCTTSAGKHPAVQLMQEPSPTPPIASVRFEDLDRNQDGIISTSLRMKGYKQFSTCFEKA